MANLLPGILSSRDIRLSIKSDIRESVAIDELHRPIQNPNEASQDTESNSSGNVTLVRFLPLSNRDGLPEHIDERNNQATKADTTKTIRHGPSESTTSSSFWETTRLSRAKEPTTVYTSDGSVDCIFEPLGDPIPVFFSKSKLSNHFDDICNSWL